jgi:hypothetical protein
MPAFPSYARLVVSGANVDAAPVVARSNMERGVPRTRRIASDPLMTVGGTILFLKYEDAESFEDWYYSAAGGNAGAGWLDWTDPRTRVARSVRIASLGALVAEADRFSICQRACTLEYVRRTY